MIFWLISYLLMRFIIFVDIYITPHYDLLITISYNIHIISIISICLPILSARILSLVASHGNPLALLASPLVTFRLDCRSPLSAYIIILLVLSILMCVRSRTKLNVLWCRMLKLNNFGRRRAGLGTFSM